MPSAIAAIQTRQETERLFETLTPLGAGAFFTSDPRLVAGYGQIDFLGISDQPFTLTILEANERSGPYVTTQIQGATLVGSTWKLCLDIAPCGTFMKVEVQNTGAVPGSMDFVGYGLPVGGGGGGGVQGSQGNIGVQGNQGSQGNQGNVGAGVQGSQGNIGVQGNQGPFGGPQGNQGNQGNQGITGSGSGPGADTTAWHNTGDAFGALKKIGTTDAFNFPIYCNNKERLTFISGANDGKLNYSVDAIGRIHLTGIVPGGDGTRIVINSDDNAHSSELEWGIGGASPLWTAYILNSVTTDLRFEVVNGGLRPLILKEDGTVNIGLGPTIFVNPSGTVSFNTASMSGTEATRFHGDNGVLIDPASGGATALKILPNGGSDPTFVVDTADGRIGIGVTPIVEIHSRKDSVSGNQFYMENQTAGGYCAMLMSPSVAFAAFGTTNCYSAGFSGAAGQEASSISLESNGLTNGIVLLTRTSAAIKFKTNEALAMTIAADGGVTVGAATGGSQGAGTINVAGDIYKNGTAYTNPKWVLQHYYSGKADNEGSYAAPKEYAGLMNLEAHEELVRENHDLPLMLLKPGCGYMERGDLLLASVEEAYLYIYQLHRRLKDLEEKLAA